MSPKPVSNHEDTRDPNHLTYCQDCQRHYWTNLGHECVSDPLDAARGIFNALICSLVIFGLLALAGVVWVHAAQAREGRAPKPIPAPQSLLRARQACPNTASLVECRGELRKAYAAVEWQRSARWHASASTSRDVVLDAIHWASHQTGVPATQLTAIAACESHLFFLAHNGQYLGVWQLGTLHRSDPIFRVVPWMDPYAQAIHVARFIKAHGESQWQCSSSGGLRW